MTSYSACQQGMIVDFRCERQSFNDMGTCKVVRRGSTNCWECFRSSFTIWLMKAFLKRLKMELEVSRTPCAVRSGTVQGRQKLTEAPVTAAHTQAARLSMSCT